DPHHRPRQPLTGHPRTPSLTAAVHLSGEDQLPCHAARSEQYGLHRAAPAGDGQSLYAACTDGGSVCAVVAEDDVERVANGVSEDSKARLTFTWDTGGTQGE